MSAPPSPRRVVVTGIGAVTDLGPSSSVMWEGLLAGRSGIASISAFEQDDQWDVRIAGEVRGLDAAAYIDHREQKRMDRVCVLGVSAAVQAAADAGFDPNGGDPYRHGVAIGSGIGGILTIEEGHKRLLAVGPAKISPFVVPKLMVNATAGNVSIMYNLRGPNTATATACATGGHAIGHAYHLIQKGDADLMFAGGTEAAVSPLCIASFGAMKALSTRNDQPEKASRPFDRDRDGFVLAEGAAVVVLEELSRAKARGARIYAEVCGFASSGDAYHIAAPDPEGAGAVHAMRMALADAQVNPDQVDYINAHGTSTPLGDVAEVKAIKAVFGNHAHRTTVSSTKSMMGHALGAAGGIESAIAALAVHHQVAPPTINLDNPDDGCDLDFAPHHAKERTIRYALNNTFGFGGHNVCVVFGRV